MGFFSIFGPRTPLPRIPREMQLGDIMCSGSVVMEYGATEPDSTSGMEPSAVTSAQLFDYVSNSNESWPLDLYGFGAEGSNTYLSYPTLARCVTVISSLLAQLLATRLTVQDIYTGNIVTTPAARRAIQLISESPDGITPASQFLEDAIGDYLMGGNAYIIVNKTTSELPDSLVKFPNSMVKVTRIPDTRNVVYTFGNSTDRAREDIDSRRIAHARWPIPSGNKTGIAPSPVKVMRPALDVGRAGDKFILDWFSEDGPIRSQVGISLKEKITTEQYSQLIVRMKTFQKSKLPIVMGQDAKFTNLNQTGQNSDGLALREYQVREVARIYGVPAPILGEMVTAWGQGIHELTRLFWVYSGKQHLHRFLSPLSFRILPEGQRFVPDLLELSSGDIAAVTALITAGIGDAQRPSVVTVKEARRMLSLSPAPDGELTTPPIDGPDQTPDPAPDTEPDQTD